MCSHCFHIFSFLSPISVPGQQHLVAKHPGVPCPSHPGRRSSAATTGFLKVGHPENASKNSSQEINTPVPLTSRFLGSAEDSPFRVLDLCLVTYAAIAAHTQPSCPLPATPPDQARKAKAQTHTDRGFSLRWGKNSSCRMGRRGVRYLQVPLWHISSGCTSLMCFC